MFVTGKDCEPAILLQVRFICLEKPPQWMGYIRRRSMSCCIKRMPKRKHRRNDLSIVSLNSNLRHHYNGTFSFTIHYVRLEET